MSSFEEKTGEFETYDELNLFYRTWYPKTKKGNFVFIGIHGAAVHSENFDNFGDYFASKGYPVYVYDRRCFGHCDEKIRGHIKSYREFIDDTKTFIKFVKKQENPEKIFLAGHSMGGAQAIIIAAENPGLVDAIVLSSPGLSLAPKDFISPFRKPIAKVLGTLIPRLKTSHFLVPEDLCKDKDRAKSRILDPLYTKKITTRWLRELFNTQKQAKKLLPKLKVPAFFALAGDDREISTKESIKHFGKIENKSIMKMNVYENHFHENFNEYKEDREKVFQDIEEFLQLK